MYPRGSRIAGSWSTDSYKLTGATPAVRPRAVQLVAKSRNPFRMDRPVVAASLVDGVFRHLVHVEEKVFLALRRDIEDRVVVRQRIFDRLVEVPGLGCDRIRHVGTRQLHLGDKRNFDRRWIANRLGEDADLIVKVRGRAD